MNEYDIDDAVRLIPKGEAPNLHAAALALSRLRGWTNSCSDGWQYWAKPSASAARLIGLVVDGQREYRRSYDWVDCTEAELKKALVPVKSFLTRRKVDWKDVLDPPPPVTAWDVSRSRPDDYSDWKAEVTNGDTLASFITWLATNRG